MAKNKNQETPADDNKVVELADPQTKEQQLLLTIKQQAEALVNKLVEVEADPNFRGVLAIASIHGYAYKGDLWINQSGPLYQSIKQYNELRDKDQAKADANKE